MHFDPTTHVYSKDGQIYTSATTLLKKYKNPFDAEFMATYKGLKDVLIQKYGDRYWSNYKRHAGGWEATVDYFRSVTHPDELEILQRKEYYIKKWQDEGTYASERGTKVHKEREDEIKAKTHVTKVVQGEQIVLMVSQDEILPMQDFYSDKVYTEIILSNDHYHIAGMVDLTEKHRKVVHLSDYKTYKEVKYSGFADQMMKYPLDKYPDANYHHAELQMSLYGWMFEQVGYKVGSLTMIHLFGEDCKEEQKYPMIYRRNDIEILLEHWKQNKDKPEPTAQCVPSTKRSSWTWTGH